MIKNIYKLNQNSNLLNKYNKQIEINKQQIYFRKHNNSFTLIKYQLSNIYYNFYFKICQIKDYLILFIYSNYIKY